MRYELEAEALEQPAELPQQLAQMPPRLERSEAAEEAPPRLGYSKEYYAQKLDQLKEQKQELENARFLRQSGTNFGIPDTESYWKDQAAQEYLKNGEETSWYRTCMEYAAEAHVEGR